MDKFQIILDSPNSIYSPGTLSGYVLIQCKAPLKSKKLTITLNGKFESLWKFVRDEEKKSNYYLFKPNKLNLITQEISLWELKDSDQFPSGESQFPFAFQLNENLPPSHDHLCNSIKYFLEARFDQPKKSTKLDFCLTSKIEPIPNPLQAIEKTKLTNVGFFKKHGQVEIKIKIEKPKFVIGEDINIVLELKNQTDQNIHKIDLILAQEATCLVKDYKPSKFITGVVQKDENDDEFEENQKVMTKISKNFSVSPEATNESKHVIQVPQVAPSFKNEESGIEVRHFLRVKVYFQSVLLKDKVSCALPIIVGNKPTIEKLHYTETVL